MGSWQKTRTRIHWAKTKQGEDVAALRLTRPMVSVFEGHASQPSPWNATIGSGNKQGWPLWIGSKFTIKLVIHPADVWSSLRAMIWESPVLESVTEKGVSCETEEPKYGRGFILIGQLRKASMRKKPCDISVSDNQILWGCVTLIPRQHTRLKRQTLGYRAVDLSNENVKHQSVLDYFYNIRVPSLENHRLQKTVGVRGSISKSDHTETEMYSLTVGSNPLGHH